MSLAHQVVPELLAPNVSDRREWASRIRAAWQSGVESIFETGRCVAAAKEELEHGEFEAMVESNLPFGKNTAHRLRAIAADGRLTKVAHGPLLPPSWRTLYELTKLSDEAFQAKISDGTINPDMERGAVAVVVRGTQGTGENEWYTPVEHIERARAVLGVIDLDPASSRAAQAVVKAAQFFTAADDGLTKEWHGRVWLNPPYAQPLIAEFVSKLVAERQSGRVRAAIMLTHNYTDTAWFHEAAGCADAICFTRGRVKFHDAKGALAAPTQGQAFTYFGDASLSFAEAFSGVGFITLPWTGEA